MNKGKFWLSCLLVFVAYQIVNILIHSVLLMEAYETTASLWRADMMQMMWVMYIADIIKCILFVYVFVRGYESKGIVEGIRFGVIISLLMVIPGMLSQYVVYPVPFSMALQWMIYHTIQMIVMGIVASLIYKPKTK